MKIQDNSIKFVKIWDMKENFKIYSEKILKFRTVPEKNEHIASTRVYDRVTIGYTPEVTLRDTLVYMYTEQPAPEVGLL